MQNIYVYTGCFIPQNELLESIKPLRLSHLARLIETPHVTFSYRPESVDATLFGNPIIIRAVSYGNDGVNEGLGVELYPDNPKLCLMAEQIATPHITISLSETGSAVNTRHLQFEPIEAIELKGLFGGFCRTREVVTTPPHASP